MWLNSRSEQEAVNLKSGLLRNRKKKKQKDSALRNPRDTFKHTSVNRTKNI